jgi:hypothetical protein
MTTAMDAYLDALQYIDRLKKQKDTLLQRIVDLKADVEYLQRVTELHEKSIKQMQQDGWGLQDQRDAYKRQLHAVIAAARNGDIAIIERIANEVQQ